MVKRLELLGKKFGRLLVIKDLGNDKYGSLWECLCDCGNIVDMNGGTLNGGNIKSCGCLHQENIENNLFKHGYSVKSNVAVSRTYKALLDARDRCYNKRVRNYSGYGGRGIKVCDRWLGNDGIHNFVEDMGIRPEGMSLDRVNNDGPYSPDNCRWASLKEQNNNKSNNHFLTYKNETKTLSQWASILDVDMRILSARSIRGWSDEKVIETPIRSRGKGL